MDESRLSSALSKFRERFLPNKCHKLVSTVARSHDGFIESTYPNVIEFRILLSLLRANRIISGLYLASRCEKSLIHELEPREDIIDVKLVIFKYTDSI